MAGDEQVQSRGRILLIEDDPVAAYFIRHVLGKRGGFEVTHTPDPVVALARARSEPWDLVLTDAELPGMTGLALLAALRRISPDLPVAVVTAHEPFDSALRELRDHSDELLHKPVDQNHLLDVATSLVARGRKERSTSGGRETRPADQDRP